MNGFDKYQLPKLQKKLNIVKFNEGSYRIKKGDITIDYFPKRGKFFNHNTQERGITDNILNYVNGQHNKHKAKIDAKTLPIQNERKRKFLEWIIGRGKMVKAEMDAAYGQDKKDLQQRLLALKRLYNFENKPDTVNT